jgi:hypothetical protein
MWFLDGQQDGLLCRVRRRSRCRAASAVPEPPCEGLLGDLEVGADELRLDVAALLDHVVADLFGRRFQVSFVGGVVVAVEGGAVAVDVAAVFACAFAAQMDAEPLRGGEVA